MLENRRTGGGRGMGGRRRRGRKQKFQEGVICQNTLKKGIQNVI